MFDLDAEYEAAARFTREWLIAPSTRRSYERAFTRFRIYCAEHGKESLPASAGTVVEWVEATIAEADDGRWLASLGATAPGAIALYHLEAGHRSPTNDALVQAAFASARRLRPPIQRARPLKLTHLIDVVHHHGNSRESDALVIGYFGALRAPELAAIEVEHVSFEERGALLRVPRPREHGQALVDVAIAHVTSEPAICPVAALRRRVDEAAGDGGTYLFPSPRGGGHASTQTIAQWIKRLTSCIEPAETGERFKPGSMVRGFCEEAFRGGATALEVARKARFSAVEAAERHRPTNDGQHPAMLVLELAATNGD